MLAARLLLDLLDQVAAALVDRSHLVGLAHGAALARHDVPSLSRAVVLRCAVLLELLLAQVQQGGLSPGRLSLSGMVAAATSPIGLLHGDLQTLLLGRKGPHVMHVLLLGTEPNDVARRLQIFDN